MKSLQVGLIDCETGNLFSVCKALQNLSVDVRLIHHPSQLFGCDVMVLPGVSSFYGMIENLQKKDLYSFILDWLHADRPFIGICVGFQLLFKNSQEFYSDKNNLHGFNKFKGNIIRMVPKNRFKVPHMGWNILKYDISSISREIFYGLPLNPFVYFAHSYTAIPEDRSIVLTQTDYIQSMVTSVFSDHCIGFQFHPEKSGEVGLKILSNVLNYFK